MKRFLMCFGTLFVAMTVLTVNAFSMPVEQVVTSIFDGTDAINININQSAITGNMTVGGTLGVTGATTLTGAATLSSTATIAGAVTAPSLLLVNGTEGTGGMTLMTATASSGALTGATDKIEVNIPAAALLVACQLRVDVAVTNGGDNTWAAAYSGGSTAEIAAAATAAAKNTKINIFHDDNAATAITSAETDITLTPQGANFTAGEITAVVYYYILTPLTDAP